MRQRPIGCLTVNEVKAVNTKEQGVETSLPKHVYTEAMH